MKILVRYALVIAALSAVAIYAYQAHTRAAAAPAANLASFAPSGALLAIEAPNFNALLKSWTTSVEQKRWLASANYAAFVRSRLFDRLGQAQDEFAATAGLPADTRFLQRIAGTRSLLAWYDIGNLEFLYITRMSPGETAKSPLLALREKFEQRKAGDTTFFIRSDTKGEYGKTRAVAFAVRGDYLLLATREDLLANALQLMQDQPDATARTLEHDPWYTRAAAAANRPPGDLRMTLNLAKIVSSPYFRTYWVQQNITELKEYSAALSDLDRTPADLREQRVLLPVDPATPPATEDLAAVLSYVPAATGVYRATAQPTTDAILNQFEDKLLSRTPATYRDTHIAPTADLTTPAAGDTSDFEQRIDEPIVIAEPRSTNLAQLRDLLTATLPSAMLVFSTAATKTPVQPGVFHPIHNAIVLSTPTPLNHTTLQRSLTAALSPRLSVATAGLAWAEHHNATATWSTLTGLSPLALSCQASICIVASDEPTLLQLLSAASAHPQTTPQLATIIAGFNHTAEREPFIRLVAFLDHKPKPTAAPTPATDADTSTDSNADTDNTDTDKTPAPTFSANIASLSRTFAALDSETFTEATVGGVTQQSVVYQWRRTPAAAPSHPFAAAPPSASAKPSP